MSRGESEAIKKVSAKTQFSQMQKIRSQNRAEKIQAEQNSICKLSEGYVDTALFNPLALFKQAKTLEERVKPFQNKHSSQAQEEEETPKIEGVEKTAEEFQNRNPEMQKKTLFHLKKSILQEDNPETIVEKLLLSYPDPYLADEALDFLCQTSTPLSKIGENLRAARNLLNNRYNREIKAGRNMSNEAREFSKQGLGSPTALRDLYRDVTGNPREPVTLFEELAESFTFDRMKTVIRFFFHSLGSDLKAKGSSISPIELRRLITEVKTMQAILSVYRFFSSRMRLIEQQFSREGLPLKENLTFEFLAKHFVKLIAQRYPSPEKVLKMAFSLGISEELLAQIIIFTQFRDALRGISPRLFKSDKQRQDFLIVLIETISELDDMLEEEEEEEEEDKTE